MGSTRLAGGFIYMFMMIGFTGMIVLGAAILDIVMPPCVDHGFTLRLVALTFILSIGALFPIVGGPVTPAKTMCIFGGSLIYSFIVWIIFFIAAAPEGERFNILMHCG